MKIFNDLYSVEHSGAYAYIIDNRNLNNNNSIPGIIVYNLEKEKALFLFLIKLFIASQLSLTFKQLKTLFFSLYFNINNLLVSSLI